MSDEFFINKYIDFRIGALAKRDVANAIEICSRILECRRMSRRMASFDIVSGVPGLLIFISIESNGFRIRECIDIADQLIRLMPDQSRVHSLEFAKSIINIANSERNSTIFNDEDREWMSRQDFLINE